MNLELTKRLSLINFLINLIASLTKGKTKKVIIAIYFIHH